MALRRVSAGEELPGEGKRIKRRPFFFGLKKQGWIGFTVSPKRNCIYMFERRSLEVLFFGRFGVHYIHKQQEVSKALGRDGLFCLNRPGELKPKQVLVDGKRPFSAGGKEEKAFEIASFCSHTAPNTF